MPDKLQAAYERKLQQEQQYIASLLQSLYATAIDEISLAASRITYNGQSFLLKNYPFLAKRIQQVLNSLHFKIYTAVINGIEAGWQLSNEKNNAIVDRRLAGKQPTLAAKAVLYDPNYDALEAFKVRKANGLNLSDRVWNTLEPFTTELELGLGIGISEGKGAAAMAKDLKQYLNEPDRLYRRVRNAEGELKLSKAAKEYSPGQGVYRSAFKNALRLTGTETNIAYRTADHERVRQLDFVIGIEVHTSNNHPEYDICDSLKGEYPKDFLFTGWHSNCRCYSTTLLTTDEQYNKMEDYILGLTDKKPVIEPVQEIPERAKEWIIDNAERINGWTTKPYWAKDNPGYVSDLLSQ